MTDGYTVPIGLLRVAFESEHVPALFEGVATHDAALKLVAQIVRHTPDDKLVEVLVRSALPDDYAGDTVKELPGMIRSARSKGFDALDPGTPSDQGRRNKRELAMLGLMELFGGARLQLFHDLSGKGFASIALASGGELNVPVRSETMRRFVRSEHYRENRKPLVGNDLDMLVETLNAAAQFDSPQFDTATRVGGDATRVFHDLGREDGAVIEITAAGHAEVFKPTIKMIRVDGMKALPTPAPGGTTMEGLKALQELLRLEDVAWILILAFIVAAFRPGGPYACLSIQGEQGAGKSLVCELIKEIIDPSITARLSMPDDERNLFIIAMHHYLIVFDNLSGLKKDISDALCKLATGGGFQTRELYSDDRLVTFSVARPFAMNGISDFVHRADLMDRTIPVHLPAMPDGARRSEVQIRDEFKSILPAILNDVYTAVACAIRNLPTTAVPTELRMADAAQWLTAAEPALGLSPGTFVRTLKAQQDEALVDLATGDTVHASLVNLLSLSKGAFEGSFSELLEKLRVYDDRKDRFFPTTPAQLSAKLNRLRTSLQRVGVNVEFLPRTHQGRRVRVTLDPEHVKTPPQY